MGRDNPEVRSHLGLVMREAEHVICFHVLTAGTCWVGLADLSMPPVALSAGDVVVVGKGDSHFFCSTPGMRGEADLSVYQRPAGRRLPIPHVLNETAGGLETCRFVCGYLGCDLRPFNPLLDALPRLFHARASAASQGWLANIPRLSTRPRTTKPAARPCWRTGRAFVRRPLRKHIVELADDRPGWFSGLRDRHVGAALRLIHAEPSRDWTLDALAHEAGLSRSLFAKRFNDLVGVSPIEYLVRWRVQLAARLLDQGVRIAEAAAASATNPKRLSAASSSASLARRRAPAAGPTNTMAVED